MVPGRVSIVVPNFNQAATLPCTVDHVLNQDWDDLEVVIVDGGSTDGTKDYLEDLVARVASEKADYLDHLELAPDGRETLVRKETPRYPPERARKLKVLSFARDIGATGTYNEGFRRITGEFCTYVVGDDIPQFHFVRRLVETLRESGADFAYSDMALVDDSGQVLRLIRKPAWSFERCLADCFHLGVSRLYRSVWHERIGRFDPAYASANDYDMYLRFAMAGCRFVHVPELLYSVRHHGEARQSGQHTPANESRLIRESIQCARRARDWLNSQTKRTA